MDSFTIAEVNIERLSFHHTEEQKELALRSKQELEASGIFSKPIVTKILPAQEFYPAEEDHQYFYKKNPKAYLEDGLNLDEMNSLKIIGRNKFIIDFLPIN